MREIRLSGSGEGAVLSRPYLINFRNNARTIVFLFTARAHFVYGFYVNVERAKYVVWAAEMPRAVSFYRSAFNASVLRQNEVLSELEIAGATIGIHAGGEGERTWTGLSFQVADVVAGAREVVAAGGQLLRDPMSDAAGEPPHLAMCAIPKATNSCSRVIDTRHVRRL